MDGRDSIPDKAEKDSSTAQLPDLLWGLCSTGNYFVAGKVVGA
jgi:hypothetical protein